MESLHQFSYPEKLYRRERQGRGLYKMRIRGELKGRVGYPLDILGLYKVLQPPVVVVDLQWVKPEFGYKLVLWYSKP